MSFINITSVILIPKISNPENFGNFRPSSLCNFIYRVITKIMTNRLKPMMNQIISPQQAAFLPGCQIQDVIVVGHECFHYLDKKRLPNALWLTSLI